MQGASAFSPDATAALLALVQSLPIVSPRPAGELLPPAWARALVVSKHPAALGALVRLASEADWFAKSPVHVGLADEARATILRAQPTFALAALYHAVGAAAASVSLSGHDGGATRHGRPPLWCACWSSRLIGRSSRTAERTAISSGAVTQLLADLLSEWDRSGDSLKWDPADYLRLCHIASLMTTMHAQRASPGKMLDNAFPVARDSALWRVAVGVGILLAVETTSSEKQHCSAPSSSETMARSVVAAMSERFESANHHIDWPALLVVAQVATIVAPFCSEVLRNKLRDACLDVLLLNDSALDSIRASAAQLGQACAAFGSVSYLIPIVHRYARKLSKDERARGRSMLTFLMGALRNDAALPGSGTATPATWLLALDALALLEIPLVANAPHRLLFFLADNVSSHQPSLLRLALLASVSVTEPAAPRARCIALMYGLVIALELVAARRTTRHVLSYKETLDDPPSSSSAEYDNGWLEASALLRSVISFSHLSPIQANSANHFIPALALDACTEIVSSAICSKAACDEAGNLLWADLLAWFSAGHCTPRDLARALDAILSGTMSQTSTLRCLGDLEKSSARWPNVERRQVAVVLALRASLRCDLRLLGQALLIAARLVRSENATGIARDAVLSADAARKDAVLAWYFSDIVGLSRPGAKL